MAALLAAFMICGCSGGDAPSGDGLWLRVGSDGAEGFVAGEDELSDAERSSILTGCAGLVAERRYEEALGPLERMVASRPMGLADSMDRDARLLLMLALFHLGRHDECVESIHASIRIYEAEPDFYLYWSYVHMIRGENLKAYRALHMGYEMSGDPDLMHLMDGFMEYVEELAPDESGAYG